MKKRGQSEFISVGVIFSIFMIIALIGVSVFVITKFVGVGRCADIALFKQDLQEDVNRAWSSDIVREEFVGKIASGVDSVCFGQEGLNGEGREFDALRLYLRHDANIFFYPADNACDKPWDKIEHIDIESFRCFPVDNGEVRIGLEKGSFDSLVNIVSVDDVSARG